MGQSAPAPGSLARSPPIRGAQVHLDAQVLPRRSRCAPCNIPPAAHACPIPNVLTRGAAARNEPSPGTEAFPHSLDSPEGTLMKATTRSQKPKAIASFVRKTLGHHYS